MLKIIILLTGLLFTRDTFSASIINENRSIHINGPIRNLEEEKDKILELSAKDNSPIYIIIDSPGGSVIAGLRFIQAMDRVKARGVDIVCIVEGMAASMAMHIFGNCSTRLSFPTSLLLWHPAYIVADGTPLTIRESERIRNQLILLTELLEERLKKALALPDEVYEEYYYNEYFVAGDRLVRMSPSFMKLIEDY